MELRYDGIRHPRRAGLGPESGYDVKAVVDRSVRFFWTASYGQIYPELRRLSDAGLVKGAAQPRAGAGAPSTHHGSRAACARGLAGPGAAGLRDPRRGPAEALLRRRVARDRGGLARRQAPLPRGEAQAAARDRGDRPAVARRCWCCATGSSRASGWSIGAPARRSGCGDGAPRGSPSLPRAPHAGARGRLLPGRGRARGRGGRPARPLRRRRSRHRA